MNLTKGIGELVGGFFGKDKISPPAPPPLQEGSKGVGTTEILGESIGTNLVPSTDETQIMTVPASVQKRVDAVIEKDTVDDLRYLLIELIRKNTGIGTPTVTRSNRYGAEYVTVKIPGKFKHETSIPRILIEEGKEGKDGIIMDENKIKIGNCIIRLDSYSGNQQSGFEVTVSGKVRDTDLQLMKTFFEEVFLREFSVNEQSALTIPVIRQLLELSEKDLIIFDEKSLDITIPVDQEIIINDTVLDAIAIALNNDSDNYSVKSRKTVADYEFRSFTIHDIEKSVKCSIKVDYKDGKLLINIKLDGYDASHIDRKFLEIMLKKFIYLLSESTVKKKNSLQALRDMGVMVFEKDADAPRKTLDALYLEDGFVGYDDIKDTLAVNIIYPWEQRDEYTRIAGEKFPNIKNIIPNTALFEGPPGTGKTTQAKIIGKYLGYPFIYLPIAKIMSEYYSVAERRLDAVFELAGKVAEETGGVIIMIDEIDEIGKNRDDSHEASGRITGVLLKKLDGIERIENILLVGSTNRKDSMDPALLSRFSRQIFFRLPNTEEIRSIFAHYFPEANNLDEESLKKLEGKSGRDIKNIAEDIARKYLEAEVIKKDEPDIALLLQEYIENMSEPVNEK